jgi:hypothetical protein
MTQPSQEGQVTPEANAAPSPVLGCRQCSVYLKNPLQGEQPACSAALRAQAGQHLST